MSTDTSPTAELFSCHHAHISTPGTSLSPSATRMGSDNAAYVSQYLPSDSLKAHPVLITLAALLQ